MKRFRYKSFTVYYLTDENGTIEIADCKVGNKSVIDLLTDKDYKEIESKIQEYESKRVEDEGKSSILSLLFPDF